MKQFPFLSIKQAIALLRLAVALVFMAHALVRVINNTIPQFSHFLDTKGFHYSTAVVWAVTVFEIAGSAALAAGWYIRWISAGFILMLVIGIILIHASFGWFVGEHGTGGSEYSFILIIALLVIASGARTANHIKMKIFSAHEKR